MTCDKRQMQKQKQKVPHVCLAACTIAGVHTGRTVPPNQDLCQEAGAHKTLVDDTLELNVQLVTQEETLYIQQPCLKGISTQRFVHVHKTRSSQKGHQGPNSDNMKAASQYRCLVEVCSPVHVLLCRGSTSSVEQHDIGRACITCT